MNKSIYLLSFAVLALGACTKSITSSTADNGAQGDSTIAPGDQLTYEVVTSDPGGWFGIWSTPDGTIESNQLDNISSGSPVYLQSGWKYTFTAPDQPFQAMISVAAKSYRKDITVNLYRNGTLLKSSTNDAMKGVAKLLINSEADELIGTTDDPVLTYEVLVSEQDESKFESDAWIGHWIDTKGDYNDINHPLQTNFAIPSGWRYSFKPGHLPFTMGIQASPYTKEGAKITVNLFVNAQLVKSAASMDWLFDMRHEVQ